MIRPLISIYIFSSLAQLSWGRNAVCTVCSGYYICGVEGYNVPECVNGHPCGREQYQLCVEMISRDPNGFLLGRNTTSPPVLDNQKGQTRYRRSAAAGDISGGFNGDLIERDFKGLAGMKYRVFGLGEKSDNETVTRTRESVYSVENVIKSIILKQRPTGTYDLAKLQTDIEEQTTQALSDVQLMELKLNISSCEDENKIKNGNSNMPSITIIAITDCNCRNRSFRSDENESESSGTSNMFDYTYETRTSPGTWATSVSRTPLISEGTPTETPISTSFTESTGIATGFSENKQRAAKIESTTGRNAAEWSTFKTSQLPPTVPISQTTEQPTQRLTTTLERSTDSSATAGNDITYSKSTENPRTGATSASPILESSSTTSQPRAPSQTTSSTNYTTTRAPSQTTSSTNYTTTRAPSQTTSSIYITTTTARNILDSTPSAASIGTNMATTPSFKTSSSVKPLDTVSLPRTAQRQPTTVEESTTASAIDIHDSKPSTQPSQTNTTFISSKPTTPSSLTRGEPNERPNENEVFTTTSAGVSALTPAFTTSAPVTATTVKEEPTTKTNYNETTVGTSPLIKSSTNEFSKAGIYTEVKKPSSTSTSDTVVVSTSPDRTTAKPSPSTHRINETTATTAGPKKRFGGRGQAFRCPSVGFFRDPSDCHSFYRCKREVVKCRDCDSSTWKLVKSRHTCMNGKWFSVSFVKCVQARPLDC